jgi:hypothetical protein
VNRLSVIDVNQFFGVAEGVIDMKAQYGYDGNADNQISTRSGRRQCLPTGRECARCASPFSSAAATSPSPGRIGCGCTVVQADGVARRGLAATS